MERPDPRFITLQRRVGGITAAVRSLILLAGSLAAIAFLPLPDGATIPLLGLWLVVTMLLVWLSQAWPAISYRHIWYRVDDDGMEIQRGVIWRVVINVPRSRVQHTDVAQGPWERRLELGTISIYTAGTKFARVSLPGLAYERALNIREQFLPRVEDDVV